MAKSVQILLVEDHLVVRQGLRLLIETQPSMRVIGEASSGEEALELLNSLSPDVVIFDVSLPGMNGIELAKAIQQSFPGQQRLLALTANEDKA
jgi:DNA-binding NarL/FixJ family response regulator